MAGPMHGGGRIPDAPPIPTDANGKCLFCTPYERCPAHDWRKPWGQQAEDAEIVPKALIENK